MASKGLRAISCQVTRNVEAGYKLSHTTETLIGYTACCMQGLSVEFTKTIKLRQLRDRYRQKQVLCETTLY